MHEWRVRLNATEATHKYNDARGDDTTAKRTTRKKFAKLKAREKSLKNVSQSGLAKTNPLTPLRDDVSQIGALVQLVQD
ncbi:hypothetical protein KIN20_026489 [Parelaphostrongylus tenuis]|uniref:Uncharacterized protein n=1 Tax=Parelaphostrongylus tenuis TaxID=148309 RepID=A0AAD5QY29_PARTN|nr:hypothetical protein KIN20_026489 [Parelaphostrongylus tenuis]